MPETYLPPTTREEAVREIMHSGFTISAMLAVALAFPLPGEVEHTARDRLGQLMIRDYGEGACAYLDAWGRGSCRWVSREQSLLGVLGPYT